MPKVVFDYSKTIIYCLVCKDVSITDCYISHTTNFKQQKSQHKCCCTKEKYKGYNYKVYKFIRQNGGWDNWFMAMIKTFPCNNI